MTVTSTSLSERHRQQIEALVRRGVERGEILARFAVLDPAVSAVDLDAVIDAVDPRAPRGVPGTRETLALAEFSLVAVASIRDQTRPTPDMALMVDDFRLAASAAADLQRLGWTAVEIATIVQHCEGVRQEYLGPLEWDEYEALQARFVTDIGPATDRGWPLTGTEIDAVLAREPSLKHTPALRIRAAFTAHGTRVRFVRVKVAPIVTAVRIHGAHADADATVGVFDVS